MALPASMSRLEKTWHYTLWTICGLVFLFLVAPILVVMPLSFNAEPYFSYPMPGYSLRWYGILFNDPVWTLAARLPAAGSPPDNDSHSVSSVNAQAGSRSTAPATIVRIARPAITRVCL